MKLQTNIKIDKLNNYWFRSDDEMDSYVRNETLHNIAKEVINYVEFTGKDEYDTVELSSIVHVITNQDFKMIINSLKDLKINADSKSEELINNIFDKLTN